MMRPMLFAILSSAALIGAAHRSAAPMSLDRPPYLEDCVLSQARGYAPSGALRSISLYGCDGIGQPTHLFVMDTLNERIIGQSTYIEDGTGVWGDSEGDIYEWRGDGALVQVNRSGTLIDTMGVWSRASPDQERLASLEAGYDGLVRFTLRNRE